MWNGLVFLPSRLAMNPLTLIQVGMGNLARRQRRCIDAVGKEQLADHGEASEKPTRERTVAFRGSRALRVLRTGKAILLNGGNARSFRVRQLAAFVDGTGRAERVRREGGRS